MSTIASTARSRSLAASRSPATRTRIVFHADDLGMNAAVDDGIVQSFEHGVLTSTAVLANGPTAVQGMARVQQASKAWRDGHSREATNRLVLHDERLPFDIGVHLNLTQGRPLTGERYPPALLEAQGRFPGAGRLFARVVTLDRRLLPAIESELSEQISFVLDHGIRPTHLNGHQYVELFPHVGSIVLRLLKRFRVPIMRLAVEHHLRRTTLTTRGPAAWGLAHVKRAFALRFGHQLNECRVAHAEKFFGTAHAGRITLNALTRWLDAVREGRLLEVCVHPGTPHDDTRPAACADTDGWCDPLAALRPQECALLCSDALSRLLAERGIRLGRLAAHCQ